MSTPDVALNSGRPFMIGEREITFRQLTNGQYASLFGWAKLQLKKQARQLFVDEDALLAAPLAQREKLRAEMRADYIEYCTTVDRMDTTDAAVLQVVASNEGDVRCLWLAAQTDQPNITEEELSRLYWSSREEAAPVLEYLQPEFVKSAIAAQEGGSPPETGSTGGQ